MYLGCAVHSVVLYGLDETLFLISIVDMCSCPIMQCKIYNDS